MGRGINGLVYQMSLEVLSMDANVSSVPKNCNGCKFKRMVSKHWELEDYCILNNKSISRMDMKKDCPLWGKEGNYVQSTTLQ